MPIDEVYRREGELIRMSMMVGPAAMIYTQQHKFHPSHHAALLAAVVAHSAARLLFRLLARALPEMNLGHYV